MKISKQLKEGGRIANNTRKNLEEEIGESVIVKDNALSYEYKEEKVIETNNQP